ncbi:MAG TPA: outer membrane beta-barrel protein [Xanthobacteraceae bacterium]|nr:outer membrane beta-barrel protein [Xanthobacteraceae bacterium]
MRLLAVLLAVMLALSGLIGLLTPAHAADYDLPTLRGTETQFIPAFPRFPNWEGFYFGGQVTYSTSSVDFTTATQPLVEQALQASTILANMTPQFWQPLGVGDVDGAGIGGFVGYNFQWDNAVFGVELNYTHTSLNAVAPSMPIERVMNFGGFNNDVALTGVGEVNVRDVLTARARFGWAVDHFLPYLAAGFAFGRADINTDATVDVKEFVPNTNPPQLSNEFVFDQSRTKSGAFLYGYSAAAGVDFALTQNIFARAEYEFVLWQRFWAINAQMHNLRAALGVRF